MPPKAKYTKEKIIEYALDIVRKNGFEALSARALGKELGTSSSPVFTFFESMDEVKGEVIATAAAIYKSYLDEDMEKGKLPPYKASGMAYIRFAKEEKELFKLLFMRDRTGEAVGDNREEIAPLIDLISKNTGIGPGSAYIFHLEMWMYVHGIASMIATSYLDWDMDFVSEALSDAYLGLCRRYEEKKEDTGK